MTMTPSSCTDSLTPTTDLRSLEALLISRCLEAATSTRKQACTCQEAHIFRLASHVLRSVHPWASDRLQRAYETHALEHSCPYQSPVCPLELGWIIGLARFRDTLCRQLARMLPK